LTWRATHGDEVRASCGVCSEVRPSAAASDFEEREKDAVLSIPLCQRGAENIVSLGPPFEGYDERDVMIMT
jgi:hypothetical protein